MNLQTELERYDLIKLADSMQALASHFNALARQPGQLTAVREVYQEKAQHLGQTADVLRCCAAALRALSAPQSDAQQRATAHAAHGDITTVRDDAAQIQCAVRTGEAAGVQSDPSA